MANVKETWQEILQHNITVRDRTSTHMIKSSKVQRTISKDKMIQGYLRIIKNDIKAQDLLLFLSL